MQGGELVTAFRRLSAGSWGEAFLELREVQIRIIVKHVKPNHTRLRLCLVQRINRIPLASFLARWKQLCLRKGSKDPGEKLRLVRTFALRAPSG
jgi:hypothetical protein